MTADQSPLRGDIAIVGMGCLFAGAPDLDTYWQNILSKVDAVSDPRAGEWDTGLFYDPESKSNDRVYCRKGGYIGDLAQFRALDFGVMPVTVDGGEPDQWLALRVAHEALADAGYGETQPEHVRTEVILGKGTYVNRGNLTVGYHGMIVDQFLQALRNLHPEHTESELQEIRKELKANLPPFSADTAPALIGNIIAGRIANRLDFMGPSFTVDAACASALLAIEIGVRDLLSGKCDMVLAGGANVNAPLPTLSLFCQLGALSRQEQIRPFDAKADGTILGEGLGMIVLKRRRDAERDGSRIYALIRGVGLASDGRALHVMAPRVEGEELALRRAYEMAEVPPGTVGLIEAHGTATPVGDVVELQALGRVFGERRGALPGCALGSVKSMIGHTMPAAGIAGVIKTALSLYHRVLPPTIHCDEPNPDLHLEKTPFYVNTEVRPWIHGAETPRRAGVNAFGFGGINGHVVLEEHPAGKQDSFSHQPHAETEVFIIEAETRQGLMERGSRLWEFLKRTSGVVLKDLAWTLNCGLQAQPWRLAIVANSAEDLARKLSGALGRLEDPQCVQIKDNAGVYFFREPLRGKIAFLFPGEGAQYPNMLLDLCVHFPEVRECFDRADRALAGGARRMLPSEFIFPRSILPEAERENVKRELWQLEGAVEAVLIANRAMRTLLGKLEVRPDTMAGHSTGDYSAMLACGVIRAEEEAFVRTIRKAYASGDETPAEAATLVAVASDVATVMRIVEETAELHLAELHLAMDNCPHQTVLAGSKDAAEELCARLRRHGIIYEILPFDRPYHTEMFAAQAVAAGARFFSQLPIAAPETELYSCTTGRRYPSTEGEIRDLFVAHWMRPVLFTETIRQMYEDGVRIFVEAGPRGNLTAFVSDILRGKPHLAIPANVTRRSGITQLNHLVGMLAAQGIGMRPDYLYARRRPVKVVWEDPAAMIPLSKPAPVKLALGLPPLKVAPRPAKPVSERPVLAEATVPVRTHAGAGLARATAMQQYLRGMEAFLDVESEVMGAFLKRQRRATAPRDYPLLGTIASLTPSRELSAVRRLSPGEDLFLRDHALGGPVSVTSPGLRPLVVLPLTMSMEILAEAATALMPGQVLTGMRDIQAHHWIQVDETPVSLYISARCLANSTREVAVQVRNAPEGPPVIEGIVTFGDGYPERPATSVPKLREERASRLPAGLYDGRLMFHGPCFQGVESIDRSGQNGVTGRLRVLPAGNLFRGMANPRLVLDPVVLDAAGQLVGFWAAENLERGFVVFPYRLQALHVYGPKRPAGERLNCQVSLELKGNDEILSHIGIVGDDGAVWMELKGWADRRFDPPARFHKAWIAPRETTISRVVEMGAGECCVLETPFTQGSAFWAELWASLVLNRSEREEFSRHRGQGELAWLRGRTAAKDAVRGFLKKRHGTELLPADVEIFEAAPGQLQVRGGRGQATAALAVAHAPGVTVAVAGETGCRCAVDIASLRETRPAGAQDESFLQGLTGADRAEWSLRLDCVRKAAPNARILAVDKPTGVVATSHGTAPTAREGGYVLAVAIHEEKTS